MAVQAAVLYADDRLVAVAKPPGVSLATGKRQPATAVARLLARLPEAERLAWGLESDAMRLVHRLDVGTSGVVLLARDDDAHRDLVGAFARRQVEKTYLALVWGRPRPAHGEWAFPLGPDRRDRRRMAVRGDGRTARTAYLVLAAARHASLLRLAPRTGRTHQIRVHAAHAGHPIVGDDLYGGPRQRGVRDRALRRALTASRPLLHAARLHLPATRSTPELVLTAPLPPDFAATLAALGLAAPEL